MPDYEFSTVSSKSANWQFEGSVAYWSMLCLGRLKITKQDHPNVRADSCAEKRRRHHPPCGQNRESAGYQPQWDNAAGGRDLRQLLLPSTLGEGRQTRTEGVNVMERMLAVQDRVNRVQEMVINVGERLHDAVEDLYEVIANVVATVLGRRRG
ncbi:hypothetical protein PG985_007903 [Apiospora marii]|uniref:t-SNARE coiled-coil homology domain-containing protein n=1 Tax=Apiospora marii TaxID=335849 RepID=A0ABR1R927_9PEZI